MDDDEDIDQFLLIALGIAVLLSHRFVLLNLEWRRRGRGRGRRRWWVRPVNRARAEQGFHHNLLRETALADHEEFFASVRMWPEQFHWLHQRVGPLLEKRSIREPLPSRLRLGMTLRYLAQGGSVRSLHDESRVGLSTCHLIIKETCQAIWDVQQPIFLPGPNEANWQRIGEDCFNLWQLPNCLGAVDGRHMRIKAPPMSGTLYHNYKGFFSIVLLAACDARYRFTWVDIGQYGSLSDGGIWARSEFGQALENNEINLPQPAPLPESAENFPYYFVGDEAFPLRPFMMRPFPGRLQQQLPDEHRIFNYRLTRARRVIENTFGILVSRWQVLHSSLSCDVEKAIVMVQSLVCLHNMLMDSNIGYMNPGLVDVEEGNGDIQGGAWREVMRNAPLQPLGRVSANRAGAFATEMRQRLAEYLSSDVGTAQAPWQFERTFRGAMLNMPQ